MGLVVAGTALRNLGVLRHGKLTVALIFQKNPANIAFLIFILLVSKMS